MTAEHGAAAAWGAFERAGWERLAGPYHRFFGPVTERVADLLLDAAGVGPGSTVLDLCCGPGYIAHRAVGRGATAVGIDIARGMVELAGQVHPGLDIRQGDAEALPFEADRFDAAVMGFGLHHLPHPERGVAEAARVLQPGGRLAMSMWDPERSRLDIVPVAVAAGATVVPADIPAPPSASTYSHEAELLPLLRPVGLGLLDIGTIEFECTYADDDALFDGCLAAALRSGPIYARQDAATKRRIRGMFRKNLDPYRTADGVRIPVVIRIAVAEKPSRT